MHGPSLLSSVQGGPCQVSPALPAHIGIFPFPIPRLFLFPSAILSASAAPALSLKKVDHSLLPDASYPKLLADLEAGGTLDWGLFTFNKLPGSQPHTGSVPWHLGTIQPAMLLKIK